MVRRLSVTCCKYHPERRGLEHFVSSTQLNLTNRQNGNQQRKQYPPISGKSRPFITTRRSGKRLNRREGTKPYKTRATITNWIRSNQGIRKDTTKHDGGYGSTVRDHILGDRPDPEPRTDETNYRIPNGGTRKPKAKEREVYRGVRHKVQGWQAQLIVYYRMVGWQNGHDEEKIL